MITIDQLLESVDLDFEPRFVTKNKNGGIYVWATRPHYISGIWFGDESVDSYIAKLKLAEFKGKSSDECIYEVPRKVDYTKYIGKLCRFLDVESGEVLYGVLTDFDDSDWPFYLGELDRWCHSCEPVRPDDDVIYKDTVNELKAKGK